jgi:hypothetical protein
MVTAALAVSMYCQKKKTNCIAKNKKIACFCDLFVFSDGGTI